MIPWWADGAAVIVGLLALVAELHAPRRSTALLVVWGGGAAAFLVLMLIELARRG